MAKDSLTLPWTKDSSFSTMDPPSQLLSSRSISCWTSYNQVKELFKNIIFHKMGQKKRTFVFKCNCYWQVGTLFLWQSAVLQWGTRETPFYHSLPKISRVKFASTSWLLLCSPCYLSVMTPPDHLVQLHHVCLSLSCFILNIFLISSVFNHHLIKTSLN